MPSNAAIHSYLIKVQENYLHPYKLVKDHRTNYQVGNTQAVLDGRLDGFMEAYLRQQVGQPA